MSLGLPSLSPSPGSAQSLGKGKRGGGPRRARERRWPSMPGCRQPIHSRGPPPQPRLVRSAARRPFIQPLSQTIAVRGPPRCQNMHQKISRNPVERALSETALARGMLSLCVCKDACPHSTCPAAAAPLKSDLGAPRLCASGSSVDTGPWATAISPNHLLHPCACSLCAELDWGAAWAAGLKL